MDPTYRRVAAAPTVGVVGGGQLARMLAEAAGPLGISQLTLVDDPDDPAASISKGTLIGPPDEASLRGLARRVDLVTFDHEGVEPATLRTLAAEGHLFRPGPGTLVYAVDKLSQRRRLEQAGVSVPRYGVCASPADVDAFAEVSGWPLVLKTPTGGYDGRGVWVVSEAADAARVLARVGRPLLVEELVPLAAELAVIVARRPSGEVVQYPVVETIQRHGICHEVIAPAPVGADVLTEASAVATRVAEVVAAIGILGVELFVRPDGAILVNEIAARPHNSGHFSIEACVTSQFENHLRAVLDWPLGSTTLRSAGAVMANVLAEAAEADPTAALPEVLAMGAVHVHLYGKTSRPGRKIGHVTVVHDGDVDQARVLAGKAAARLGAA